MSLEVKFSELIGKTITDIQGAQKGSDVIRIKCDDGTEYQMWHRQDCCESVSIEDVSGDVADLIGSPITMADESSNSDNPPKHADSFTWTFYKLATIKGFVDIRWLGESNGYYSEGVDFARTK